MSGSVVLPFAMLGAFRPQQAASRILGLYTVKSITSNVVLFFIFLGVCMRSAQKLMLRSVGWEITGYV